MTPCGGSGRPDLSLISLDRWQVRTENESTWTLASSACSTPSSPSHIIYCFVGFSPSRFRRGHFLRLKCQARLPSLASGQKNSSQYASRLERGTCKEAAGMLSAQQTLVRGEPQGSTFLRLGPIASLCVGALAINAGKAGV